MYLLILGANSDVAYALAKKFAQAERSNIFLASRNLELLKKRSQDLKIRYNVHTTVHYFDATSYEDHPNFYESLQPKPDGVILAFGYLGDQEKGQNDFSEAKKIFEINLLGAVSILEVIARDFEKRGHGFVIGISSVAGGRGRQSNYLYGAAKGGVTVYLSGLRNRLYKQRIQVITVLLGFVKSKMTEHLELPELLLSNPEEVAIEIYKAWQQEKEIIYVKWYWRLIMIIIKFLPEKLFKRLKL